MTTLYDKIIYIYSSSKNVCHAVLFTHVHQCILPIVVVVVVAVVVLVLVLVTN